MSGRMLGSFLLWRRLRSPPLAVRYEKGGELSQQEKVGGPILWRGKMVARV